MFCFCIFNDLLLKHCLYFAYYYCYYIDLKRITVLDID